MINDLNIYIQKLEAENLRLQDLLAIKDAELNAKRRESYIKGFRTGINQSESMSNHVLEEWRKSNLQQCKTIFK